jgi:hypothetical protein
MEGTPVPVVFFKSPVASPASEVLLSFVTVTVFPEFVTSPARAVPVNPPAVPVVFWLSVGKVQFAKLPEAGVPRAGVTKVGEFVIATLPVPELFAHVTTPPPAATKTCPIEPAAVNVVTPTPD